MFLESTNSDSGLSEFLSSCINSNELEGFVITQLMAGAAKNNSNKIKSIILLFIKTPTIPLHWMSWWTIPAPLRTSPALPVPAATRSPFPRKALTSSSPSKNERVHRNLSYPPVRTDDQPGADFSGHPCPDDAGSPEAQLLLRNLRPVHGRPAAFGRHGRGCGGRV